MKQGVAHTAANVEKSWIGTDIDAALEELIPGTVETLNDADAAGIAEMRYGAGRDRAGVVLMLTFGTGIGSALFVDGHLVPTRSSGTSRWTARTANAGRRQRPRTARNSATPTGHVGSTATSTSWRPVSGRT